MKKKDIKMWMCSLTLLTVLMVSSGCFEFVNILQPGSAEPVGSFVVQISATITDGNGGNYVPYFGILLPIGWTVNDSIIYTCDTTGGMFVYSDSLALEMGNISPPPFNYYWWVGAGVDFVIYEPNTYLFNPVIYTDNQAGNFYMAYMLGSSSQPYGGLGSVISENHLITVGLPDQVVVTSPADSGPGTLRNAVDEVDYYGTIKFDMDLDDIILHSPIQLDKSLKIIGPEQANQVISGNEQCNLFNISESGTPYLQNLSLIHGSNEYGGAIYCGEGANLTLNKVTMEGNSASDQGGALYCNNVFNLTLQDVLIKDNSANEGGGLFCAYSTDIRIHRVTISENTANNGGGIYSNASELKFNDLILTDNAATNTGGGIYLKEASQMEVINALITGNSAFQGGAFYMNNSASDFRSSTICNNTAIDKGGAIYSLSAGTTVLNTIMWDNIPQQIALPIYTFDNWISISWSDIEGGQEGIFNSNGTIYWGEGAINELPYFSGTVGHPYSLGHLSPLIDLGTYDTTSLNLPENDLLGNLRLWDGDDDGEARIDIGAYEFASMPVGFAEFRSGTLETGLGNYPNPFTISTAIIYTLAESVKVNLRIYDSYGRLVDEPIDEFQQKGEQKVEWKAEGLPAGMYYYRLQSGDNMVTGKIVKTK